MKMIQGHECFGLVRWGFSISSSLYAVLFISVPDGGKASYTTWPLVSLAGRRHIIFEVINVKIGGDGFSLWFCVETS